MTVQPHGVEHAASSESFELLLQVSSEGICVLDAEGLCTEISVAGARLLGYQPRVTLDAGLVEFAEWLDGQVADDRVDEAREQLATRGLTV